LLKSRGFWIGIAVSVVLIGLFVRSTDFGEVRTAFEDVNWLLALASLPVYFLGLWVRTIRWQDLLRPVKRVSAIRLYPVVIIGLMANNLIPARGGGLTPPPPPTRPPTGPTLEPARPASATPPPHDAISNGASADSA
jgi:uncharacterized membrane protein YbhN (UPF0104 family)